MKEVSESDRLFVLEDADGESVRGTTNRIGGKVMTLVASDFTNDNWFSNNFSWNNTKTGTHGFGHAAELTHNDANGSGDLMKQGGKHMIELQNTINKGANSYLGKPYPFVHDPVTRQKYIAYKL